MRGYDMNGPVSWAVSPGVLEAIGAVCARYHELREAHSMPEVDGLELNMDLTACHANGCPMDWAMLLAADDFTFVHDIVGIQGHIDRATGRISRFFPRCAMPRITVMGAGGSGGVKENET